MHDIGFEPMNLLGRALEAREFDRFSNHAHFASSFIFHFFVCCKGTK